MSRFRPYNAAVTSRHFHRWLVAAVLVVAFASTGFGRDVPASSLPSPTSAAATVPGVAAVHGADAVVPPRVTTLSVAERALKLPGLTFIVAAAAAAVPVAARARSRRRGGSALLPALRRRAVRRRGPPVLSLA
jgi:hypothetical protein